jgi:hypothetical protein
MAVSVKSWVVMPVTVVEVYLCFGGMYYLHLQVEEQAEQAGKQEP